MGSVEYVYYNDNHDLAKTKLINQYIDQIVKVMEFLSKKVEPYRCQEFRIVEIPVTRAGFEFSRLIQIPRVSPDEEPLKNRRFVHETTHQWFHSTMGNDSQTESFLDEGFTEFYTRYFFEE